MRKQTSPRNGRIKMTKGLVKYIPPQLKKLPCGTYIEYEAIDSKGELKRKRHYLNKFKGKRLKVVSGQMIKELNRKLEQGWSPFLDQEPKAFLTLASVAISEFTQEKKKEMREQSIRSLNSKMKALNEYVHSNSDVVTCLELNSDFAKAIMRQVYARKKTSPTTYNNYLNWFKSFGGWCVSAGYMRVNPFSGIAKKRAQEKSRKPIPSGVLDTVMDHFKQTDPGKYVAFNLVLYGMRPNEVLQLKLSDVSVKSRTISIDLEVSKTGKHRIYTIPKSILSELDFLVNEGKQNCFLFSDGFKPGSKRRDTKYMRDAWAKMRVKTGISSDFKPYSLRDTGIVMMLNKGISVKRIMDQVGHSSLDITTIYAKYMIKTADPVIGDL